MKRSAPACMSVCLLLALSAGAADSTDKPATMPLKVDRVALFKNGLGYFSSTGVLPGKATTVTIGQLPVPSFGTFWVGYDKGVKVRSLVTSMQATDETTTVQNIGQLLLQNVGRKVSIRTGIKDDGVIEGTILKVGGDTTPRDPPNPYFMDARISIDRYGRPIDYGYSPVVPQPANIVLIKTASGIVTMNAGSIMRADFEGDHVVTTSPVQRKQPSIRLELAKDAGGEKVGVSYLARGITWLPSYLIDISDAKTAKFSAKSLVMNEIMDLDNVVLDLVTGFPNIKFAELPSPVSMAQNLADFLNAFASGRNERGADRYGNRYMMQQQALVYNMATYAESAPPVPSYSTAAEGTVSEDLFLYPVKSVSLKKGETTVIPLFTAEMPFKHIYTWKVEDMLDENESYRSRRNSDRPDGQIAEEVWHSCRLQNNMKMPLTTAAAEFIKDNQFVGQDVCFYTAPGAETTIRINRAMNVLAEQAEFEVERKRNAAHFYGCSYDLVKVRGEMKVKSRVDKPVNIEITKELSGEVLEKTPDAKDIATAKGLKKVNPKHVLVWNLEIKPGEETKTEYIYQVYVRN